MLREKGVLLLMVMMLKEKRRNILHTWRMPVRAVRGRKSVMWSNQLGDQDPDSNS